MTCRSRRTPTLPASGAAVLLAAALTGCAHSSTVPPCTDLTVATRPGTTPPKAVPDPHPNLEGTLPNFRVIDPGAVFRGGRPPPGGVDALAQAGVHTLIDLQGGDLESAALRHVVAYAEVGETPEAISSERQAAETVGIHFVHLPLNSFHRLTPVEVAEVMTALETMHDPAAQPVYVHCEHGKDRTGMVSALYRVRYQGWSPEDAHAEMISSGHAGFLDHLATGAMDEDFAEIAAIFMATRPAPH